MTQRNFGLKSVYRSPVVRGPSRFTWFCIAAIACGIILAVGW